MHPLLLSLSLLLPTSALSTPTTAPLHSHQNPPNQEVSLGYYTALGTLTSFPLLLPDLTNVRISNTDIPISSTQPDHNGLLHVNVYPGIPYAAPPDRFQKAKAYDRCQDNEEVETAWQRGDFGYRCWENWKGAGSDSITRRITGYNKAPTQSEDCLSVNIYVPAGAEPVTPPSDNDDCGSVISNPDGLPVLFAIHGGGLQTGTSSGFDWTQMAGEENVIVVSVNYRLTFFGFPPPNYPQYTPNLGLHDQLAALAWTQSFIPFFGGNPTKITLWGISAGAQSVDAILTSPSTPSPPPFAAAIMQSGQISKGTLANEGVWKGGSQSSGADFANDLTCPDPAQDPEGFAACFTAEQASEILERDAFSFFAFREGDTLALDPTAGKRWDEGTAARVPVLTGTSTGEGRFLRQALLELPTLNLGLWAWRELGIYVLEEGLNKVIAAYGGGFAEESNEKTREFFKIAQVVTEMTWQCPQAQVANRSARNGQPTWRYIFDIPTGNAYNYPEDTAFLGAFHGSDSILMFQDPTRSDTNAPNYDDTAINSARKLRALWGNFIRNPDQGPGWDSISGDDSDTVVVFGDDDLFVKSTAAEKDSRCGLFDGLYETLGADQGTGTWD